MRLPRKLLLQRADPLLSSASDSEYEASKKTVVAKKPDPSSSTDSDSEDEAPKKADSSSSSDSDSDLNEIEHC